MDKPSVFVFDLDDTLCKNRHQYDEAYLSFFSYLHEIFSPLTPCLHTIYRKFFELEQVNAKIYGIKKQRILYSMLDTYNRICEYINSKHRINLLSTEHIDRITIIAEMPFDYRGVTWIPGAEETLRYLKAHGHKLCLLSSYDNTIFPEKKEFLGLSRFFNDHDILTPEFAKTKEDFISVSGWNTSTKVDYEKCYTVGNGTSDIMPPIDISDMWWGLYIGCKTTSPYFENTDSNFEAGPIDHSRVINLKNIKEVLKYI